MSLKRAVLLKTPIRSSMSAWTYAWMLGLAFLSGCKHAPKSSDSGAFTNRLHRFVPYTLRVRRPTVPGANPKVGPGGVDYHTQPLPDAHYDCQKPEWLLSDLKLADVRACFATLTKPARVRYRVKWLPVPFLELVVDDETDPCLKTLLPTIPLPREIFFQSTEGDHLACYSARLDVEANEWAGFKLPIAKLAVTVQFPLAHLPVDDNETRMLIMGWALTPYWEPSSKTFSAHIVPDAICVVCLGAQTMIKPTDPAPALWPE